MLRSTYIHIRGITPTIERSLWQQGATSWDVFLQAPHKWDIQGEDNRRVARLVSNSRRRLDVADYRYFRKRVPQREHWRAFQEFSDKVVYLDIETDGGWAPSSITTIGCYDGAEFRIFIKGKDLNDFPKYIQRFAMIVTFFGTGFDVPILRKMYFTVPMDQLHVDLCILMRRLGYRGGLKRIERSFGIVRDVDIEGFTGRDAIRLWRHYERGDKAALDLLVRYNREDAMNLKTLMVRTYDLLRADLIPAPTAPHPCESSPPTRLF